VSIPVIDQSFVLSLAQYDHGDDGSGLPEYRRLFLSSPDTGLCV